MEMIKCITRTDYPHSTHPNFNELYFFNSLQRLFGTNSGQFRLVNSYEAMCPAPIDLKEFVKQYYQNERDARGADPNSAEQEDQIMLPLKNSVSNRKNKNRINLPRNFLQFLADPDCGFVTVTSKVAKVKTSGDGSTTKLAVQLHDGQLVESVLMRYGPKTDGKVIEKCGRAALCVSR